jgi:hypothetical protein
LHVLGERYDAKRPLVSFRLAKGDVERFDTWRGSRTRSEGAAQLVTEGLVREQRAPQANKGDGRSVESGVS